MIVHSGAKRASIPIEPAPISNAKLAAELQALALAIRIGGLEGLRSGSVKVSNKSRQQEFEQ